MRRIKTWLATLATIGLASTCAVALPLKADLASSAEPKGKAFDKVAIVCNAWGQCWQAGPYYGGGGYYGGYGGYGYRGYGGYYRGYRGYGGGWNRGWGGGWGHRGWDGRDWHGGRWGHFD